MRDSYLAECGVGAFLGLLGRLALMTVRPVPLVLAVASLHPAPSQAAGDWLLTFRQAAIEAPSDCKIAKTTPDAAMCMLKRKDGSTLFVVLSEALAAEPVAGRKIDIAEGVDLVMGDGFQKIMENMVQGSAIRTVTAAQMPSSKLPRGMTACKTYTIVQSGGDLENVSTRAKGVFCAVPQSNGDIMAMTAFVTSMVTSGQKQPADFDAEAARILATYRRK